MKNILCPVLTAAAMAGCGGGTATPEGTFGAMTAVRTSAPQSTVQGLAGDIGTQARAIRLATPAQAAQIEHDLDGRFVSVLVEPCCGRKAVDLAALLGWGIQAAANLPAEVPFIVQGADPELLAATANQLLEGGAYNVWIVVP